MRLIVLAFVALPAFAQPTSDNPVSALKEQRYCGEPKRNASGDIIRRADVVRAFRSVHACPATGLTTGTCAGWQVDHVIPLACGGCDAVSNLQWLPLSLKLWPSGKDSFERRIYCTPKL